MSDCCSSSCESRQPATKHICPANGIEYKQVPYRTVVHHLRKPWQWMSATHNYYFCEDPDCGVVYFGDDNSTIEKHLLRTSVGIKDPSQDSTICYCFGVTRGEAIADQSIRAYVTMQTKNHICDCKIRNPSGKCCLRDFPGS